MFRTPDFWVLIAFVLFFAIVYAVGGFRGIFGGLDARGKRIAAELDEAKRLREEAARVLAEYESRRAAAQGEADAIVSAAREEAERLAAEAHTRMTDFVARRTAAAEQKIANAEAAATQQVRAAAAEAAIRASETVLRDQMRNGAAEEFLSRSLGEVRGKLRA